MYAQSTKHSTCHDCFFVVRHVGKAWLESTVDKIERVESSQVEFGPYTVIYMYLLTQWRPERCKSVFAVLDNFYQCYNTGP